MNKIIGLREITDKDLNVGFFRVDAERDEAYGPFYNAFRLFVFWHGDECTLSYRCSSDMTSTVDYKAALNDTMKLLPASELFPRSRHVQIKDLQISKTR